MATLTLEEKEQLRQKKSERKEIISKFKKEFRVTFLIGIKAGVICCGLAIVIYLAVKNLLQWNLFYETDINYAAIFLIMALLFFILVVVCMVIATVLYRNKHKRNTKYEKKGITDYEK